MILDYECDYYNDLMDNEFSPYPLECESCYIWETCKDWFDYKFGAKIEDRDLN